MKTRILILVVVCAVITLSFTFAATRRSAESQPVVKTESAPVGGFVSENSK